MRVDRELLHQVRDVAVNRLRAPAYARSSLSVQDVPAGAVVIYFAAIPAEIYQLTQWRYALRRLSERTPVVVVVARPDIGRLVTRETGFPVLFAARGVQLERLIQTRRVGAVLYLNHREQNFRVLRYAETTHVYLGHGESDKGASASHQNMAYDYCFVAGPAGRERLERALPLFDASVRAPMVGRPNLDEPPQVGAGPEDLPDATGRTTVLYAPTWEGGLPSMALGSTATHGPALVDAVLADPAYRLIYRPHPLTGSVSPSQGAADRDLRARVERAGAPHVVDTGDYGWQLRVSDAAVVDISSVAYDWLATGRPMLLTVPSDPLATSTRSRLLDEAPRLAAGEAGSVPQLLGELLANPTEGWADVVAHHFGDTTPGASTERFLAAVDAVLRR